MIILAVLGIFLISGCTQKGTNGESMIDPTVTLEATILSIIINDYCPVDEQPCPIDTNPDDWGEIKIDKIVEYQGSWWNDSRVHYQPLVEGEVRKIKFGYSTRPAKIKCVEYSNQISNQYSNENKSESSDIVEPAKPPENETVRLIPREDGFFVFDYLTGKCPPERILHGLKEGNKIRFNSAYQANSLRVFDYEIIG